MKTENPFPLAEPIIPSRYDLIKQAAEKLPAKEQNHSVVGNLIHAVDAHFINQIPGDIFNGSLQ